MKLTLPQRDIYFEQLLYPGEPIYNIGAKIEIKGVLDLQCLRTAYIKLIDQHDAYRSIVITEQEDAGIRILDEHQSELGFVDLSGNADPEEMAEEYMQRKFMIPFDLAAGELLHVFTLVKVREEHHYLFSVYHHIITDGWGTSLMFQRLVKNYNEILQYGSVITDYPYRYESFAADDGNYECSEEYEADRKYWVERFQTLPDCPFEQCDDSVRGNKSGRKKLIIPRTQYDELNSMAVKYKCSVFHLILAVLFTYFARKHEKNDIAIGLPVLNRAKAAFKKTVGLFMGMTPLRCKIDFEHAFTDLLEQIKAQLRQDYRHQRFPLGKLIQALRTYGSKEKLFHITLSYEKQDYSIDFLNTKTTVIPLTHQSERVALAVYVREFDEQQDVELDFDYNLKYFDEVQAASVTRHFANLLEEILLKPAGRISELEYLGKAERDMLLETFNATDVPCLPERTLIDMFTKQARLRPDALAVKDDQVTYSYAELDQRSDSIAAYFSEMPGDNRAPVAVMVGRSAGLLVVLLGILKAGRAYIPLDPSFPVARLNYIIADSRVSLLVGELALLTADISVAGNVVYYEELLVLPEYPGRPLLPQIGFSDNAYIIYTSGSTGNPKGVVVGHRSLSNFLCSMLDAPGFAVGDLLFSVTTYSFDISILEFFAPLISGAAVYMAGQSVLADPDLIIQRLSALNPTIIQATPGFYQMLFHAGWTGLPTLRVLCGGDLLSRSLAGKLASSSAIVWNMYGPTETTIWSSMHVVRQEGDAGIIGRPISNTRVYILDACKRLKPVGVGGAIFIAGEGLAKGYWERPELTVEKFVANPYEPGTLMYDTGDLGAWRPDGTLQILGRKDHQVKVRGYRIELGEIEAQLNQLANVAAAVVVARTANEQESILVAYIQWRMYAVPTSEQDMIHLLQEQLPQYMIPARIITVTDFPMTPNAKIDRKALSALELKNEAGEPLQAMLSGLELRLLEYWQEVLDYDGGIRVNDNFFSLGGHSLNAVRLVKLIRENLAIQVALHTIFEYPTVSKLAQYLQKADNHPPDRIAVQDSRDYYELTVPQYHIWLAAQQESISIAYNMPAAYRIEGYIDLERLRRSVKTLIRRYEILRTNFIEVNNRPYQKVADFDDTALVIAGVEVPDGAVDERIATLINQPFDLAQDLLLRIWVIMTPGKEDTLLFCTHHLIMDGLSLEIFIREFVNSYNEGSAAPEPLRFQFKDYSEWANRHYAEKQEVNRLFWHNYLGQYRSWSLLSAYNRSAGNQHRRGAHAFSLSAGTTVGLRNIAAAEQVTFFTLLTAAFNLALHRFLGHEDLCIGTVNAARNVIGLDDQIGMFVKTLILRTRIDKGQSFVAFMHTVQAGLLQIDIHQDIDSGTLSAALFDILFAYQNPDFAHDAVITLDGASLHARPADLGYSKLPVVFSVFDQESGLKGLIEYDRDLFDAGFVELLALKYGKILSEIEKNPLIPLAAVDDRLEEETNMPAGLDFDFNF